MDLVENTLLHFLLNCQCALVRPPDSEGSEGLGLSTKTGRPFRITKKFKVLGARSLLQFSFKVCSLTLLNAIC